MKMKIVFFMLCTLITFTGISESGPAVAKAKGGGHKQAMPQQLPPGYMVGPNGIQKIPQVESSESIAQEAVESAQEEAAEVVDEVDLSQIVEALQSSSQPWELIIRQQDKEAVVQEFIRNYQQEGIVIHKPAAFYATFINEMSKGGAEMLNLPFPRLLQVVAVMEYDFDNGQDKDLLAQKILGAKLYENNRKRLVSQAQANSQGQMHQ